MLLIRNPSYERILNLLKCADYNTDTKKNNENKQTKKGKLKKKEKERRIKNIKKTYKKQNKL